MHETGPSAATERLAGPGQPLEAEAPAGAAPDPYTVEVAEKEARKAAKAGKPAKAGKAAKKGKKS